MAYSLAWLVVVGVVGAVLGGMLGHLVARVRSRSAERIRELEAELESARGENSEYRHEVIDQFAATARKFKSLDESYNDLHRQLAESASILCGEAAGPLLEAPRAQSSSVENEENEAAEETPLAVVEELEDDASGHEQVPILVSEVTTPVVETAELDEDESPDSDDGGPEGDGPEGDGPGDEAQAIDTAEVHELDRNASGRQAGDAA
jgi:uncharacterized membrane-anchored protein YhcB (DUF1043 family)